MDQRITATEEQKVEQRITATEEQKATARVFAEKLVWLSDRDNGSRKVAEEARQKDNHDDAIRFQHSADRYAYAVNALNSVIYELGLRRIVDIELCKEEYSR